MPGNHSPAPRRGRFRVLVVVLGILLLNVLAVRPAAAAAEDCAPYPEQPGAGLVGTIDEPAPDKGDLLDDTPYYNYMYAGTTWHNYNDGELAVICGSPPGLAFTWAGNSMFNVGKTFVASTNALWYVMRSANSPMTAIDESLSGGSQSLYDHAFVPLLGVALAIATVCLLCYALRGKLVKLTGHALWILAALWFAASSFLMPAAYTTAADNLLTDGINTVQGTVLEANGYDSRHGLPELLYDNVIANTWKAGNFGSADSPLAERHSARLLRDQAWSTTETAENSSPNEAKNRQRDWIELAEQLKNTSAYATFTGESPERLGIGFLGMARGFCYSIFPLLALLGQLLGMLILRVVILAAPLLGLAIIIAPKFAPGLLRGLGKTLAGCLFLAIASTVYLWLLSAVMATVTQPFLQLLVMLLLTVLALAAVRPIRQLYGMVGGVTTAVGLGNQGDKVSRFRMIKSMRREWREHKMNRRMKHLGKAIGGAFSDEEDPKKGGTKKSQPRPESLPAAAPAAGTTGSSREASTGPAAWAHAQRVPPDRTRYHPASHTAGALGGSPGTGTTPGGHRPAAGDRGPDAPPRGGPPTGPSGDSSGGGVAAQPRTQADPSDPPPRTPEPGSDRSGSHRSGGFVVASEHEAEQQRRARAESEDPDGPRPAPEHTDSETGQRIYRIWRPSDDRTDGPDAKQPPRDQNPDRPENDDRGNS